MQPITVLSVFGTRPEAIKMAPLIQSIQTHPMLHSVVCVTAQHRQMLDQVLDVFHIAPDYDLNLMRAGQTLADITSGVLTQLGGILSQVKPNLVLVHGDTTTSFAAALAAFYQQIPVGHVEAGLRSGNKYSPYPEEMNRRLTSAIADLHFAPTETNRANLLAEGVPPARIVVTGNTVIDALLSIVREGYTFKSSELSRMHFSGMRTLLLTAHRRENLGVPMRQIFAAIRQIVERYPDVQVIYPLHMNPAVRDPARQLLGNLPRIHLIEPVDVEDMHNLLSRCCLVLTDSGGLQEEAPALGKPVLVLRTETERPEAVQMGTVRIAGVVTDDIVREVSRLLDNADAYNAMSRAVNPYGDGRASERICEAIVAHCAQNTQDS